MITKLSGKRVSPLGIGTWGTGGWVLADRREDRMQIESLRFAIENGINAIDTAELYGRGHAEELIAEAIKGEDRETLHITSKVSPTHLNRRGILNAAENSLRRLGTKYLDLYLIHWPNPMADMDEAISAMEELVDTGRITSFGVSNFDVGDMQNAIASTRKYDIEANQIEYSLLMRDAEEDVIPFCEKNRIKVIAYTPLAKGRVARSAKIAAVGERYGRTAVQVALNYLMKRSLPIPKAAKIYHLREILGCMGWKLRDKDYNLLRRI